MKLKGLSLSFLCRKRLLCFSIKVSPKLKNPKIVSITGAAGNIAYAMLPRIAIGDMLGDDQPIIIKLIDVNSKMDVLKGVAMELEDMACPLLRKVIITDSLEEGFDESEFAILIGAKAQDKGVERSELLKQNTKIFIDDGIILNKFANKTCKVLVVGNPSNTNCLIAKSHAPGIPEENFTGMTMLDHTRAIYQLSVKLNVGVEEIENFCIWGNHGPTMFPDCRYVTVHGENIYHKLDKQWMEEFINKIRKRWFEIQEARGWTSVASPANAAILHMRNWVLGSNGKWVSFSVISKGEYGIKKGIIYSYPVTCENGKWQIVPNLIIPTEDYKYLKISENELIEEDLKARKIEHDLQN